MNPYIPTPNPRQWRRKFYAACIAIPFTLMQMWAITVVLSTASFEGAAAIAFPLALSGTLIAVLAGWRWVARLERQSDERRHPALVT